MQLSRTEKSMLGGSDGAAVAMAMRILVDMGEVLGADKLVSIKSAHIDGCLYHGESGVDFAEMLVAKGAKVVIEASTNVGALDLLHPGKVRLKGHQRNLAERLMKAYMAMGCTPSWTCAPYQAGYRPKQGEQIAWAESNAVVFANSVLGARTNRYGDFLDICAAITGRVPYSGLHMDENRQASILVTTDKLSQALKARDCFYPVLGAWLGRNVGTDIAAIDGLPSGIGEDALKALGAAAASSGAVGLFHAIGITPEAPTIEAAFGGHEPREVINLSADMIDAARAILSTDSGGSVDVIALGSPHFSLDEISALQAFLNGRTAKLPIYVCTGRHVIDVIEADGRAAALEDQGVEFIIDTCVVVTPIIRGIDGILMTNSGKFAHYTPPNLGYGVQFGSLKECIETAVSGKRVRVSEDWV